MTLVSDCSCSDIPLVHVDSRRTIKCRNYLHNSKYQGQQSHPMFRLHVDISLLLVSSVKMWIHRDPTKLKSSHSSSSTWSPYYFLTEINISKEIVSAHSSTGMLKDKTAPVPTQHKPVEMRESLVVSMTAVMSWRFYFLPSNFYLPLQSLNHHPCQKLSKRLKGKLIKKVETWSRRPGIKG